MKEKTVPVVEKKYVCIKNFFTIPVCILLQRLEIIAILMQYKSGNNPVDKHTRI